MTEKVQVAEQPPTEPEEEEELPEECCARCKFWGFMELSTTKDPIGTCRRYPPSLQSGDMTDVPVTPADWYCGEFQLLEDDVPILRRDEVVKRLAQLHTKQIQTVTEMLNNVLQTAQVLPIRMRKADLGPSPEAWNEIERQLKEAGYRVSVVKAENGSDTVEIQ